VTFPQATTRTLLLLLATAAAAAQTQNPAQAPVSPASPSPVTLPSPTAPHKLRAKPPTRPPQPPYNPNLIVLDPAHGGSDPGAKLGSGEQEKDFNVAFATRLKTLLEAQQFTVVLTHSSADDDPTPDQRAEATNRSRPVACLILHATAAGHGVHLFTSALTAPFFTGDAASDTSITPWDSAQGPSIPKSLELANELSTSLNGLRVPLVVTRVSVRPIDSLTCPAVAVEIAPSAPDASVADDVYDQQVAQSLAKALSYWRDHAKAQIAAQLAAFEAANPGATITPASAIKPKSTPKPISPPTESPLAPKAAPPAHKPAPIERRPPPTVTNPPAGAQR
jgi:N-acetylmuramoyl-L-alanine amidase